MVRAPCCEKMGLKKGPWTVEEDAILTSYIHKHGHGNWRALPKLAGLQRCGKSCRLRWTNYLRPDIKRGNFTKEEEETIINLHENLGNRWSAIAARLPGRTDNEIKNVWHTHLKKRLKNYQSPLNSKRHSTNMPKCDDKCSPEPEHLNQNTTTGQDGGTSVRHNVASPSRSASDVSSMTDLSSAAIEDLNNSAGVKCEGMNTSDCFTHIDESFWSDELLVDAPGARPDNLGLEGDELIVEFSYSTLTASLEQGVDFGSEIREDIEFWYNIFIKAEDLPELPEI